MSDAEVDQGRRTWIAITCGAGAVGGVAVAVPFVASMAPSERAKAAGAPVEVDISGAQAGREDDRRMARQAGVDRAPHARAAGRRCRSSTAQLADPKSEAQPGELTPDYATQRIPRRSSPSIFVAVGICSHLGCSPVDKFQPGAQPSLPDDWDGGFLCPCHGSTFDLAGRVYKNKPAPDNLEVPPHMYLSDTHAADRRRQEGLTRSTGTTDNMAEFKQAPAGAPDRRSS